MPAVDLRSESTRNRPRFTVVVPTRERPVELGMCLDGLAALQYPPSRFEVVVVDDGSATSPRTTIERFQPHLALRLVVQERSGPAAARNLGVAHAAGCLLAFLDDDCVPALDWLAVLDQILSLEPNSLVGGPMRNELPGNIYATTSHLVIDALYANQNAEPTDARFLTTSNMALSVDRFHAVGGFDVSFPRAGGEDREFCDRWRSHGGKIIFSPQALVHHHHGLSFLSLWRQQATYGRGLCRFHHARRSRGQGRPLPAPSLYTTMVRLALRAGSRRRRLVLLALLALTQAALAFGFTLEELQLRRSGRHRFLR